MDWLRNSTKNWELKTSVMLYMLSSLFFSIPFGFFYQSTLKEIRKNYILSNALSHTNGFLEKWVISKGVTIFLDSIPLLFVLLFFYVAFHLFYKHKIQSVLEFLDHQGEIDIKEKNELSDKVFELSQKNRKLVEENFINIRKINEMSKKMDTILHEIKNPLTILSGDIEMLHANFISDDERLKRILLRMSRSEKRIQDYINNLKKSEDLSELKVDLRPVSFVDLMEALKKDLNHWDKEIIFTHDLKDLFQTVNIDLELFLEGLTNILKNSERYSKSTITVSLYETEEYFMIEVEDDGPGFSQEALCNYNKPYFSENPLVGNMGLGLYITDEIMKKNGIKMVLSNHVGANTKLFIKKS